MSIKTFALIILLLSVISITMTLVAAYYLALLKDEQSKNQVKSQTKN